LWRTDSLPLSPRRLAHFHPDVFPSVIPTPSPSVIPSEVEGSRSRPGALPSTEIPRRRSLLGMTGKGHHPEAPLPHRRNTLRSVSRRLPPLSLPTLLPFCHPERSRGIPVAVRGPLFGVSPSDDKEGTLFR